MEEFKVREDRGCRRGLSVRGDRTKNPWLLICEFALDDSGGAQ